MTREPLPDTGPPTRTTDLRMAGEWPARHDLADTHPPPLLASRLAVRRRARLATYVILAALIIVSALAATSAFGGLQPRRPLLALAASVAGLLPAQSLIDRWVRRVDQRAGATPSRRAAHTIQPGRQAVLGRPYAVFAVATFAGALVPAASALAVPDPTLRQPAVVVLIGLLGATAITALQLRHPLSFPVVAEDEESPAADVIMRVEDAREHTPQPPGHGLVPTLSFLSYINSG
ncbi:hypothetical protein SAMN05216275_122116 [Streptosporangium canum]|uniref:Uncharacterized protein n=1 Tax=Streptosporangium canum TaxID=324952 RepID=A0A1I3YMT0_9ACTN|nr:hypothetical protein [Streptosporangium canum]SFK33132.1 hypothetical protein SAMN05216275_122116 [Streptosporangium canum]